MADRYLRANGNWNSPVWAATSGGAAGSAATPTANDRVYIDGGHTVTLVGNANCGNLSHITGSVKLAGYKLSITDYLDSGTGAKTLDMVNSTLEIIAHNNTFPASMGNANTTILSSGSLIAISISRNTPASFWLNLRNATLNDVIIDIGTAHSHSYVLDLQGSPTFRSLIIQSKNSAAHTVNFDSGSTITANKFVAIGSSSANKLTLGVSGSTYAAVEFGDTGTSYGQYVYIKDSGTAAVLTPERNGLTDEDYSYIGSNSTQDPFGSWLLQDPPKISTLVDPLTTSPGSNSNWTVTGTSSDNTVTSVTSGKGGGGYKFENQEPV